MGPQLENGFTMLANQVLEDIAMTNFNGSQIKLILAIISKTYSECERDKEGEIKKDGKGRPIKKREAVISIGELVDLTGLSNSKVRENLDLLVEWNVINKKTSISRRPSVFSYQKHSKFWRVPDRI